MKLTGRMVIGFDRVAGAGRAFTAVGSLAAERFQRPIAYQAPLPHPEVRPLP